MIIIVVINQDHYEVRSSVVGGEGLCKHAHLTL